MNESLDWWGYDTEALNVVDLFHGAKFVIYVEGDEDIIFWSTLLDKFGVTDYYVDNLGGIRELEKVMSQIINEDAKVIAACDSDYSFLLRTPYVHDRIIRTFGYSIENTMYCSKILNGVINKLGRVRFNNSKLISRVINKFCDDAYQLLTYDLANEKSGKGLEVMGNNGSRFLKSATSITLDDGKVATRIDQIRHLFKRKELKECETLISQSDREIRNIVRGSFITACAINLVKAISKKYSDKNPVIPLQNFYALTCDGCKACTNECQDLVFVGEQLKKAIATLS